MSTKRKSILQTNKSNCLTTNSRQATNWLNEGQLLAYPTESVWGLGCDPYNQLAVQRILDIKQRPMTKGLIVISDKVERLAPFLNNLTTSQRKQVEQSWRAPDCPNLNNRQAQTWLLPLPQNHNIPTWITGEHNSVAVRVIAHPLIQNLCANMVSERNPFGFVISTSCNPATKPPATTFIEAHNYFDQQICYLQGDTLGYTQPSQIKDAVTGKVIR